LTLCRMLAMMRHTAATSNRFMLCKTHVGPHARRRKSKREFSTKQTSAKFILQGTAAARCYYVAERQQSPSLPRRQLGCCTAKLMLALTHADEKANANSALSKYPQNSSYKVQLLHAAIMLQSGGNRLRSLVADFVAVLQNSCWPSRTTTKTINLTRVSIFTRLISPVVMRAANATQSASETSHSLASILSLSTSNFLCPNFTFTFGIIPAVEVRTRAPGKIALQCHVLQRMRQGGGPGGGGGEGKENLRHPIFPRTM
jgi:hypothetical protein